MNRKQVFVLEIMDDQKDTWQGQLRWVQGHRELAFRSVLEMLHLIDSVLNESTGEPQRADRKLGWTRQWTAKPMERETDLFAQDITAAGTRTTKPVEGETDLFAQDITVAGTGTAKPVEGKADPE